jgi:hypothetical protein
VPSHPPPLGFAPRTFSGGAAVTSVGNLISFREAWNRVAKLLFPGEEVTFVTDRDAWLIDRYVPPGQEVSFLDHRTQAPEALCAEVDLAYYHRSQADRIGDWFEAQGFDLSALWAVSRSDFEARLPVKSAKAAVRRISHADMPRFVREYLHSTADPTLSGVRAEWAKIHSASNRRELDAEYRRQFKRKQGSSLKPGRPSKRAQI